MSSPSKPSDRASPATPVSLEMWDLVDRTIDVAGDLVANIDSEAMRLSMTLRTASNVMFYDIHAELRRSEGISAGVLNILLVLQVHGELEFTRVAKFAGMTKASASALVNSMVEQGLLRRRGDDVDRRRSLFTVTEEGKALCIRATALLNLREIFWATGLSSVERNQLIALLNKLISSRLDDIDVRRR